MERNSRAARILRKLERGRQHHQAGRLAEAERAYRDVLRVEPGNPELHHRLAEVYRALGDYERAHREYLRATSIRPDFVEAHVNAAISAEQAAAKADGAGDRPEAQRWRAIAAQHLRRVGELHAAVRSGKRAEMAFRRALELDANSAETYCSYGDLLFRMGRVTEAEPLFRAALARAPRMVRALNNLASTLEELGRLDDAEAIYRQVLDLDPASESAAYALSSGKLLNLCYRADMSAEAFFEAHRSWGAALIARQTDPPPEFANEHDPDRRLRIGYVSPDFRQHSIVHFFETLLARHDRTKFDTYCYAEVAEPDAVTRRLQNLAGNWRSTVGLGDRELRRAVRADGIDILIDLAGHTGRTRLSAIAIRPAPVTATWLGYPATTGLPTVDYRITDAIADPPEAADRLHTERLVRLSGGFLCYRPPADAPPVAPTPALARGYVTFGSFNNLAKVNPEVFRAWGEVLRAVPTARLLLKGKLLADETTANGYRRQFAELGIAAERLELRPLTPGIAEHMRLYSEVDIGLDPFPYNGTTTTCEALFMGVPVVTLVGDRHAARVGLSLLSRVGLSELAAPNSGAYVKIALELARDVEALNALRLGMRDRLQSSPLMDETRFAREFESALREMWRRWCDPAHRPPEGSPTPSGRY